MMPTIPIAATTKRDADGAAVVAIGVAVVLIDWHSRHCRVAVVVVVGDLLQKRPATDSRPDVRSDRLRPPREGVSEELLMRRPLRLLPPLWPPQPDAVGLDAMQTRVQSDVMRRTCFALHQTDALPPIVVDGGVVVVVALPQLLLLL